MANHCIEMSVHVFSLMNLSLSFWWLGMKWQREHLCLSLYTVITLYAWLHYSLKNSDTKCNCMVQLFFCWSYTSHWNHVFKLLVRTKFIFSRLRTWGFTVQQGLIEESLNWTELSIAFQLVLQLMIIFNTNFGFQHFFLFLFLFGLTGPSLKCAPRRICEFLLIYAPFKVGGSSTVPCWLGATHTLGRKCPEHSKTLRN